MIVRSDKSFLKDLEKIQDQKIKSLVRDVINDLKNANTISAVKNIKKLTGYKSFYRIRIGNYRVAIELNEPKEITLIRLLHRKDAYKKWP